MNPPISTVPFMSHAAFLAEVYETVNLLHQDPVQRLVRAQGCWFQAATGCSKDRWPAFEVFWDEGLVYMVDRRCIIEVNRRCVSLTYLHFVSSLECVGKVGYILVRISRNI